MPSRKAGLVASRAMVSAYRAGTTAATALPGFRRYVPKGGPQGLKP